MRIPIDGVRIGHWTDDVALTGCTVVLLPEGTVASGEVRGGAPATREFDLLAPERTVDHIDAVVALGPHRIAADGAGVQSENHRPLGIDGLAARIVQGALIGHGNGCVLTQNQSRANQ